MHNPARGQCQTQAVGHIDLCLWVCTQLAQEVRASLWIVAQLRDQCCSAFGRHIFQPVGSSEALRPARDEGGQPYGAGLHQGHDDRQGTVTRHQPGQETCGSLCIKPEQKAAIGLVPYHAGGACALHSCDHEG